MLTQKMRQISRAFCLWAIVMVAVLPVGYAKADVLSELLPSAPDAQSQGDKGTVIASKSSIQQDSDLRKRISGIFSELEGLEQVEVDVANSVVSLSGELDSTALVTRAITLASQVEGVVEVADEMTVNANVVHRVDKALDDLQQSGKSFFVTLPTILLALFCIAAAWWLGRLLAKQDYLFRRVAPNTFIADLIANLCWTGITILGVLLALSLLDATSLIGTVLGAAGIFGLAIGFAARDTVENYIASILLSLRNPFKIRDTVTIDGMTGSVARLTSRATILVSSDGNHIRIPNATVYKSVITNYSRNPQRRFEFKLAVGCDVDIKHAQDLALEVLQEIPGILEQPGSAVLVDELADLKVVFIVRGWLDQRTHDLGKVRGEAIRQIKAAYDDANITMPAPSYHIQMSAISASAAQLSHALDSVHGNEPMPNITTTPEMQERVDEYDPDVQADTSVDVSTKATIEKEILLPEGENLLESDAPHE